MFGPNTHLKTDIFVSESHRDFSSKQLIRTLRNTFTEKFDLQNYDIIFLLGGGSLGVESLIYSSKLPVNIVGVEGDFTERWRVLASIYNPLKKLSASQTKQQVLYSQLETSVSTFQLFSEGCVDAVSSFPYVNIPSNAAAFVTSSNKVIGSFVGLTIVGIRKDLRLDFLNKEDASYLSLAKYFRYMDADQTPSTTSIHNMRHLLDTIQKTDYEKVNQRINDLSDLITQTVGVEHIIGATRSPVINVRAYRIPTHLAEKWSLYLKPRNGGIYQIFTYSCAFGDYEAFCKELSEYL